MKKIFILFLLASSRAFADNTCHLSQDVDGSWRIVCEGTGIVYNYVDVTNEVYAYKDCENLKSTLLDVINNNYRLATEAESQIIITQSHLGDLSPYLSTPASTNIYNSAQDSLEEALARVGYVQSTMSPIEWQNPDSLYSLVNGINCGSCPTNGASGGGECCDVDLTEIIDRLIVAEHQRSIISNQINRVLNYLGVITNALAYSNFLQEHGWSNTTNLLDEIAGYFIYTSYDEYSIDSDNAERYYKQLFNGIIHQTAPYWVDVDSTLAALLGSISWTLEESIPSLNNYQYNFQYRLFPHFTNQVGSISRELSNIRADINPPHSLSRWNGGSIYDYLTNEYLTTIHESPSNWHHRVETLLAALVFQDSAEEEEEEDEKEDISQGLEDVKGQESELQSSFDHEGIDFLDVESLDQFEIPDLSNSDELPEFLDINVGTYNVFGYNVNFQTVRIEISDDLSEFLSVVRAFFTVLWWGLLLLFVWWLFKWFLHFIKWVWSAFKGIDFGS